VNRILVTGATGFLGRHFIRALRARAPEVGVVALSRKGTPVEGCVAIAGSVEFPQAWTGHPALDGVDAIVHLAAKVAHDRAEAEATRKVNVDGTVAMVELAGRLGAKMVFVSTSGTVGVFEHPDGWADEQSPYVMHRVKRWPYYASKIEAEIAATARAEALDVSLVIVRPPVLLGPDDPTMRSVKHVTRILGGKLPALVDGGMHFVDVRSAAEALVGLVLDDAPPVIVHLPGTASSLRDFADRVADLSGATAPRWVLPWQPVHLAARVSRRLAMPVGLPDPVLVEMGRHWWGLKTRHAERIGWDPIDGDVTLQDTIDWVRRQS